MSAQQCVLPCMAIGGPECVQSTPMGFGLQWERFTTASANTTCEKHKLAQIVSISGFGLAVVFEATVAYLTVLQFLYCDFDKPLSTQVRPYPIGKDWVTGRLQIFSYLDNRSLVHDDSLQFWIFHIILRMRMGHHLRQHHGYFLKRVCKHTT